MNTRCKFVCEYVQKFAYGASIRLHPVHNSSEENSIFYSYTPGGELKLEVVNPVVAEQFQPGKEYYIDISLAE
jgi:hypothetical protein